MPNGLYKNGAWRNNVRVYNEPCDEEDGAITPHAVKEMIGSSGEVLVTQAQYDALTPEPDTKYVIYETI